MIELYDTLTWALHNRLPLESVRYEAEYSRDCLRRIANFVASHEGEMALYFRKDGKKEVVPKLVQIHQITNSGAILRYKCYDPEGRFRTHLLAHCGWVDLYCRDSQLKIFGNI